MNGQSRQQALDVLGLPDRASKDEIKQAFHKLASAYHPDVNDAPDATEYYLCIQSAYEYLMSLPEESVTYYGNVAVGEPQMHYHGNVAVGAPQPDAGYAGQAAPYTVSGNSRIIGSRETLSLAATRRAFKEEHRRQEVRLKHREEQRKKEEQERFEQERRERIFEEAMARIHAIRAAEITASIIEDVLKNGNGGIKK